MTNPWHAGTVLLGALTVLLVAADARLARSEEQAPAATAPAQANCQPTAFRAVVDVGHTLDVPGALSARGVPEYAFNLQLARQIKETLVGAGFDKTDLLITAKAPPVGLFERAMVANRLPADLFISIHHDLVPSTISCRPGSTKTRTSTTTTTIRAMPCSSRKTMPTAPAVCVRQVFGQGASGPRLAVHAALRVPLMRHRRRELLDADAGVYRYDELVVLRDTHMPALLLEAGSIVNRQEEPVLATPERRALTSAAVAAAVEDFCAARMRPQVERR